MVRLWRGLHSQELYNLVGESWVSDDLLILCPYHLRDFSFLKFFARDTVQFHGEWSSELKELMPESGFASALFFTEQATAKIGIFTSGTQSGKARLVFYTRENVQASLEGIRELFDEQKIDQIFCYPQASHTFGLTLGYLHSHLYRIPLIFEDGAYSHRCHERWLKCLTPGTLTLGTPTHFIDLIQWVKKQGEQPPASYSAIIGGARVSQKLWREIQSVLNIQQPSVGYGATEAAPGVTHLMPGVEPIEDGDIGTPLRGVEILSLSEKGLRFTGKNMCAAIVENENLFFPDSILLKDVVTERTAGAGLTSRLIYGGRTDLVINRGGTKISLEAVETFLAAHIEAKVVAVALYNPRLGEDLGLLIQPNSVPNEETLISQVQTLLRDNFMVNVPNEQIAIGEVPLNASAKPDRRECLRRVLPKRALVYPVPVELIGEFMPHRGKAVWINEIIESRKSYGRGRVILSEAANYVTDGKIRESACVEWVAQTYGFTLTVNDLWKIQAAYDANKGFIAEIRSSEFFFDGQEYSVDDLKEIIVEAECTHDFGPLKVVRGSIMAPTLNNKVLAQISLKLYCKK